MVNSSVSVIIPCYCCADTIERAVLSVIAQSLPVQEIILINDGSTDDTEQVLDQLINTYSSYPIQKISFDSNYGVSHARNTGWEEAQSNYIAFLDADDSWHPDKIQLQYTWMKEHPHIAFSGHPRILASDSTKYSISQMSSPNFKEVSKYWALLFSLFSTSSLMLQKSISLRFDHQKSYCEDSLLWRELILTDHKAVVFPYPLAYRFKAAYGEDGLSKKLWNMEVNQLESYYRFWRSDYLNVLEWAVFSTWSLMKYVRRLMLSQTRKSLKP